jgi:DNA-binding transcriptional LysR family regulator
MVIGRPQRRHPNFAGIQAAVSAGLGVSILSDVAILADHQILRVKDGFPSVGDTELALIAAPDASPATRASPISSPSSALPPGPRAVP